MNRRFIIRPLAEADIADGIRWYATQRAGLAERFLSDVKETFTTTSGHLATTVRRVNVSDR